MEDVAGRARAWLPAVLYCAVIFLLSALPAQRMPEGGFWRFDKLIHAVVYAGLGLLFLRALGLRHARLGRLGAAIVAVLGATLYGASDEWHQSFVAGRQASILDLLADAAGAAVAVGVASLVRLRRSASRA